MSVPDLMWWTPDDVLAVSSILEALGHARPDLQRKGESGLAHFTRRIAYLSGQVKGLGMIEPALSRLATNVADALRIARDVQVQALKYKRLKPRKRRR